MSYAINLTDGSTLIPGGLSDGTTDTSHTSLTLIGKNYAGYGQSLNDNLVHLLENFSDSSAPTNPLIGQFWWDNINNHMKVYTGTSWKISTGATSAPYSNPPADVSPLGGDLWLDTTNSQLKVWSGTGWLLVGPQATAITGDSGAVPSVMTDTSSANHVVIQMRINGVIYAIFSKDTFASSLTGFPIIKAGINYNTSASPQWGISTQDTSPTPNTLVERDGSGAITATAISVSNGISGVLMTPAQPNITQVGTITNLSTTGTTTLVGSATYNGLLIATTGSPSDRKFKENIEPIKNAVSAVQHIGGKMFDWNNLVPTMATGRDCGVIAQDVLDVLPEAVIHADGYLAVDYSKLVSLAFQAIIELKAEIEILKAK